MINIFVGQKNIIIMINIFICIYHICDVRKSATYNVGPPTVYIHRPQAIQEKIKGKAKKQKRREKSNSHRSACLPSQTEHQWQLLSLRCFCQILYRPIELRIRFHYTNPPAYHQSGILTFPVLLNTPRIYFNSQQAVTMSLQPPQCLVLQASLPY